MRIYIYIQSGGRQERNVENKTKTTAAMKRAISCSPIAGQWQSNEKKCVASPKNTHAVQTFNHE